MELPSAASARFQVALLRARVRALEAGLDLQAEQVAASVWSVPSISRPNQSHLVIRREHGYSCDCEAATFGRSCTHVQAVACLQERAQ